MNLFQFSVFAALAVFVSPIFSQTAPGSDRFEELFKAKAPIKEIIAHLMTIDPTTNYQHLQTIQLHIRKNDKYAAYSKLLLAAGQKVFDHLLREIKYDEGVNIVTFINSAFKVANGLPVQDTKIENLISQLNLYMQNLFEEAFEEAQKNIMGKLLGVIDEPAKKEEIPLKKEVNGAEKAPTGKQAPQLKKSPSSVSEPKANAGAVGERRLRRSKSSKPAAPSAEN